MGVTVRPYRTEDETGVVALLKRSYAGLAQKTDSEVSTWGTPIFSPTWGNRLMHVYFRINMARLF